MMVTEEDEGGDDEADGDKKDTSVIGSSTAQAGFTKLRMCWFC